MQYRKLFMKTIGLLLLVVLLCAAMPTGEVQAADIDVNCTASCDQTTIQAAIDAADPGSTINVSGGPYVFASAINVNKAITLNGVGNPLIQVSGTGYRIILSAAGSTLQGFDIEKTDKTGVQNIISVRNSDITIQNNRIWGQFEIGDGEVSRAMEIQAGAYSNLLISNNEISGLRQPAYVNGTHTGVVSNNYTHGTKGWVVAGGSLTFVDNTWGTGAEANVYDIAVLAGVDPSYYPNVAAMAAANNGAFIEDQRTSPATLSIVYVDGSVAASGDGTERSPKKTIAEGLQRVAEGGVVNVLPGVYAEQIELNKPNITVRSTDGSDVTIIDVPDGTLTTGVKVLANMGTVTFDGFTIKDFTEGGIIQGMSAGAGTAFRVLNNKVIPAADYLRNGIQVSGDGSVVSGNYVEGAYLTDDWASTAIGVVNASNVLVENNEVSGSINGVDYGIAVYNWNVESMQNIQVLGNKLYNVDYPLDVTAYHATVSNVTFEFNKLTNYVDPLWVGPYNAGSYDGVSVDNVDASPNWWGSIGGPQGEISDGIEFMPWCGDEECTFLVPDGNGVITLSGNINIPGGIMVNQPGLTFFLEDGTVIQNDSPCFVINADYTTITTESPLGAVCMPTDGSNAFEVNDDRTNIIIEGLEIAGADGTNGIDFDGVATDLVIRDTYIHGLPGAGLYFAAQPAGVVQIQGNLFMDNGGNGIEAGAFLIPAEFNSWGFYDGPAAGDGISAGVDADPWTYADVYLESALTDYPNSVYLGEEITFDITANLVNAMGADFVLEFPAELTLLDATPGGLFDTESIDAAANSVHFYGYQIASEALTGEDLVLFSVAFEGAAAGKPLTLNLDEMSDIFSMAPGYGPSTNIYAAELSDITDAEVNAFPTMDIVPAGAYVAGLPIEFSVDIDNADGDDFDSVGLSFSLPGDAILEYWDGSAWVAVSSDPFVLGALAADAAPSLPFRVLFVSSGENIVAVELYDLTPDPDRLLAEAEESFITLGDFDVTGTVSMQGRTVRSGVPMKLVSMTVPYYPDNGIFSSNEISNNVLFEGVNGGLYQISTDQPRYLNVSVGMVRLLDVSGDVVLPALELKGGNADWSDNVIDISDAGIVGGQYGTGGLADDGDVNFDDRVNIQDLALVGGNYDLTSEEAYAGWPGFTEVSGTFAVNETTGAFTADLSGAYSLHIVGQGAPAGPNLTSFTGLVSGDITGTIEGMINAQGMDILYAVITPASGDPVRLYGTLLGEFEGWLVGGAERAPVESVEITGPASVAVGGTIDLDVLLNGAAADRPVLWSVYVNHSDLVDVDLLTGEVTGKQAGTATVIVTVLDDSNVSYETISITVTP